MADLRDRQEAITPVELSTNPLVRMLFRDRVDNPLGREILEIPEERVRIEEWDGSQDVECKHQRDVAITRAVALIMFIQIPAGFLSFAVSPTVEWEIIGGCIAALLMLKLAVMKTGSASAVALGAVVANVLMGALLGELIHFGWEVSQFFIELTSVGAAAVALTLAAAFYLCLVGDGWYALKTQRMRIEVTPKDDQVYVRELPFKLSDRERWWLSWGISAAPIWSPFHAFYLLCRLVDWLSLEFFMSPLLEIWVPKAYRRR